jgi:predicted transcriptional regulator
MWVFPVERRSASVIVNTAGCRCPLLAQIADTHPESLHELAATTGRTPGNLSRTLKTMERYGLVRLHHGERGKVRPEVPYQEVRLEMRLAS